MNSTNIIIGLGANLGSREETLEKAIGFIRARVGPVGLRSRTYETPPLVLPGVDPREVPDYLNMVVQVETELSPKQCLEALLLIERELGRDRTQETARWVSRVIDLDIIAIGTLHVNDPSLKIPHPEMHKRLFVLEPMCEVAPDWEHPIFKKSARELLQELRAENV